MSYSVVYEKDLLYPTDSLYEPGSVRVKILDPNKKAKIPVIVESRTGHSPLDYIESVLNVIQTDVLNRVHLDVKKNVLLYFKVNETMEEKYPNKKYIIVSCDNDKIECLGVDEIDFE